MRIHKLVTTVVVIALCYASVRAGTHFFGPQGTIAQSRSPVVKAKGDPKAPLWVVKYFDYQCGACRGLGQALDRLIEAYPGQIYLQLRHRPLKQHPQAKEAALFAECGGRQDKFWALHEKLFAKQEEWRDQTVDHRERFLGYASEAGVDTVKMSACVDDPDMRRNLDEQIAEADSLSIDITPTLFINGKRAAGVQASLQALRDYFEPHPAAEPEKAP